ncbi:MAG TPA: hypothetical protein VMW16_03060 [Sedimentisphaerales bacterium]|nr:hypothetical protein [Sedimentisphaerales bacterium]
MTTTLKEVTIDQLAKLKINELRHLCEEEGLETGGKRMDLFKRLFVQKTGRSDTFSPANTKCRICNEPVKVTGTQRRQLTEGRTLVTRQIRCTGKHRHTYPLKEIIQPELPKPEPSESNTEIVQNSEEVHEES